MKELAAKAEPQDVFLIYVAGHGVALACGGEGRAQHRFLGYEASQRSKSTVCQHSLSDQQLAKLVRGVPARKKVIVLDICQAGAAASQQVLLAMRGVQEMEAIQRLARAEGMTVIAAAPAAKAARMGATPASPPARETRRRGRAVSGGDV